jgi:hypothetical protein
LKKRTKKLLDSNAHVAPGADRSDQKFFASFFQKRSPYFLSRRQAKSLDPQDPPATAKLSS